MAIAEPGDVTGYLEVRKHVLHNTTSGIFNQGSDVWRLTF